MTTKQLKRKTPAVQNDRTYDAEFCRQNGWKVSDVLEGTNACNETALIRLTAIGEQHIYAVWNRGNGWEPTETATALTSRPWVSGWSTGSHHANRSNQR